MTLTLSPHYPLAALSGLVRTIETSSPQQVVPTPLINEPGQSKSVIDCSSSCRLILQIAPQITVHLEIQTTLPVQVGSWVWVLARLPRKVVKGFDAYPYVDPQATLTSVLLQACDLQIDNTYDDNAPSCDQLAPNTIDDDHGAWLFGATGASSLISVIGL
jgi:hypothetical protein